MQRIQKQYSRRPRKNAIPWATGLLFSLGILHGVLFITPSWAETPHFTKRILPVVSRNDKRDLPLLSSPTQPPPAEPVFPEGNIPISRIGLFEAMATGVKTGIKDRTDQILHALVSATPTNHTPSPLRSWLQEAGLNGSPDKDTEGNSQREFDPISIWNLIALAMEKETAPTEPGGGEPSPSLLRTAALSLAIDIRGIYWRSATADLLLTEFDNLLQETNTLLVADGGPHQPHAPATPQTIQNQKILLETTEKLWKSRNMLAATKERLAHLTHVTDGPASIRVLAAATELQDPGILTLPVIFLEDHALAQWAERMNLPKDQRLNAQQAERALLAAFPGFVFTGLGHETGKINPAGAPSWVEAGMMLTEQLLQNRKSQSPPATTDTKVLNLVHGAATLLRLHLALLDCQNTERSLTQIRAQNKSGLPPSLTSPYKHLDPPIAGILHKTEGLMMRMHQGFAFANAQVALSRLLISLGYDPIPPMPGLENLAPSTLTANIALRNESATATLLAALNADMEPNLKDQLKAISDSTPPTDKEGMWQRMRDFSQKKGSPPSRSATPKETARTRFPGQQDASEPAEGEMVPISGD
ncbi:MAG: hypothetical protein HQL07_06955 [Nitrospirae bacterium]|nr:hypothetical protein [Magnetococcales bacterium]